MMKNVLLLILAFASTCHSQVPAKNINQVDALDRRTGFWVDPDSISSFLEANHNGAFLCFHNNTGYPTIAFFSIDRDDKPNRTNISFHLNGSVWKIFTDIRPNLGEYSHDNYVPDYGYLYQAYCYCFNEKNRLICEGYCLIGDDIEFEPVGLWKIHRDVDIIETIDVDNDVDNIDRTEYSELFKAIM